MIMPNDTEQFDDIANTLMDELSLVSDKEQNREVFKVERDLNAEPGEIVLNEDELDFINYCVPDEFLKENGLNVNCYRDHLSAVLCRREPNYRQLSSRPGPVVAASVAHWRRW